MKNYRAVLVIGLIEIFIGGVTLIGTLGALVLSLNTKTANVLLFVLITGIMSTLLGVGILKFKKFAYQFLLYFSSVIILTKLLIFADIMHLNGELTTFIPSTIKNSISIVYHGLVVYYLSKPGIKDLFHA